METLEQWEDPNIWTGIDTIVTNVRNSFVYGSNYTVIKKLSINNYQHKYNIEILLLGQAFVIMTITSSGLKFE